MDPINYQAAFPQIDIGRQFLAGLQSGALLGQMTQQREAQQLAQQQAAMYQADVSEFQQNPTPQGAAALQLKYPAQHEAIGKAWAGMSSDQQKAQLNDAWTIASTLHSDRPDLALQQIDQRIAAHKNSGQPTDDLEALRAQVQTDPKAAYGQVLHLVSGIPGGDKILENLKTVGAEARLEALAPGEIEKQTAAIAETKTKTAGEKTSLIGQTMGALQGKNVNPAQVATAFRTLAAKGVISKDELPIYLNDIPADPKEIESFLNTYKLSGMKPSEQMKFTTPTAGEKLQAETTRRGQNLEQQRFEAEQKAANEPAAPNETMAKQIAFYKAAPLGQFSLNKPWGQATMDRVMQLNPEYDAAQYAPRAAALKSFAAGGKEAVGIDSVNIGMNHIDTLRGLALAQKTGNLQAFNRLANAWATQTGNPAPTNLRMATDMVAPEIVKAVSGVGGTGEERAHFGKSLTGNGSYSPDQIVGALNQAQELFAGRLKEKKRSYERSTKLENFDEFLSPAAKTLLRGKAEGKPEGKAIAKSAGIHPADIDVLLNKYEKP